MTNTLSKTTFWSLLCLKFSSLVPGMDSFEKKSPSINQKSNPKVVDDYDNHIEDGQWNNYLRYIIYKLYLGNNNKVQFDDFDVDGFVDKRVEDYITKGLNV